MSISNSTAHPGYANHFAELEAERSAARRSLILTLATWLLIGACIGTLLALVTGCVQARAPGSAASLHLFSSRLMTIGTASNVVQTVEGGASPSTTATVPIR
jgi:hypothetical protein